MGREALDAKVYIVLCVVLDGWCKFNVHVRSLLGDVADKAIGR